MLFFTPKGGDEQDHDWDKEGQEICEGVFLIINEMIVGICNGVEEIFRDVLEGFAIYREGIEGEFIRPCFFISAIQSTNQLYKNRQYFRAHQFQIQYFSSSTQPRAECNSVLEKLFAGLKQIKVVESLGGNSLVKASNMRGEMMEGGLNFFVQYNCFVEEEEIPVSKMAVLAADHQVKG